MAAGIHDGEEFIFKSRVTTFAIPETDMTLPEFVLDGVEGYLHDVAIVDSSDGRKYTYGDFTRLLKNVAAGLADLGVKRGDVVCVILPNIAEYYILAFGIITVGGIFSGCNPYAHHSEIKKQVLDSDAKLVITNPENLSKMTEINVPIVVIGGEAPSGTIPVQVLFTADGSKAPTVSMAADDVCLLPYSSGTTGLPKGVMLTHRNLVANLCQTMSQKQAHFSSDQLAPRENILGLIPFFHIYGLMGIGCAVLRGRGTIVVMERYEIRKLLQVLIDYEIHYAPLVPPIILNLVKNPVVDEFDLSALKLRGILCASAPLSSDIQHAFEKKFPGVVVTQAYGLTEYSCVTLSHPSGVGSPGADLVPAKQGSVGLIMPGTKLKFLDPLTGRTLPPNAHGEICIKGPTVMKGYFKNPIATEETIDNDGWLHTGDIGYIDDDGDVFIVERLKELIKYKGFQVSPAELEALFLSHPAVLDAAVVGVPEDEAGELPAACLILKPDASVTAEEVKEFVNSQVSSYKKIRFIELVPEIPKSTSGKILRRTLRDEVILKYRGWIQSKL